MAYLVTISGTLVLSVIAFVMLYFFARSKMNLTSRIPLPLRAIFAASLTSWIFYFGVWGQMFALPSLYFIYKLSDEFFYNPKMDAESLLVFYYAIIDLVSKTLFFVILTLKSTIGAAKPKTWESQLISAVSYGLVGVTIGCGWLLNSFALPCQFEIKGVCYDRPKASNPPISVRFEAVDADTGKPLPGVMISLYWEAYLGTGKPDHCARNVIGETDANGKFANTAKDGSWMYSEIQMFKAGWERIYFDRLIGQTFISHEYKISTGERGMYPAWERQLQLMGYLLDTTSSTYIYRKRFELGNQYEKIMTAEWQPEGLRTYWVKMRGFPEGLTPPQIGTQCFNRQLGKTDPNAEMVGFELQKFKPSSLELMRSKHALQAICDDKWDSVPASYTWSPTSRLVGNAGSAFADNLPQLKILLPDLYGDNPIGHSGFSRPLTHDERIGYCAAAYKNLEKNHE